MITVLIPTHNHPLLLPYALESVQEQTVDALEILVVCDGVEDDTREVLWQAIQDDHRVHVYDNLKGERHGETWRHAALQDAKGEIVCYQADDDLWTPRHLEQMQELARRADVFHSQHLSISPAETNRKYEELQDPGIQQRMREGENFFPLNVVGHTLSAYRALPHGWRPAPEGTYTDLYMWQQFLGQPLRFSSGDKATALHFPSVQRQAWTPQQREQELKSWAERYTVTPDP